MSALPGCPSDLSTLTQDDDDVRAVIDAYDTRMSALVLLGMDAYEARTALGRAWTHYRRLHPQADRITEERD